MLNEAKSGGAEGLSCLFGLREWIFTTDGVESLDSLLRGHLCSLLHSLQEKRDQMCWNIRKSEIEFIVDLSYQSYFSAEGSLLKKDKNHFRNIKKSGHPQLPSFAKKKGEAITTTVR